MRREREEGEVRVGEGERDATINHMGAWTFCGTHIHSVCSLTYTQASSFVT